MSTLVQKMLEVRKSVPYLQKGERNQQQGFNYTGSSRVLGAVRAAMDEQGIILIPSVEASRITEKQMSNGSTWYLTELDLIFTWINADDPKDTIVVKWYGQGLDSSEKGPGKALTYAEKYLILKTFQIPTDKDDPDAWEEKTTGGDDQPKTQRKPANKTKPSAQPAQNRSTREPVPQGGGQPITGPQRKLMFRLATDHFGDAGRDTLRAYFDAHPDGLTLREASEDIEKMQAGDFTMLEPFLPDVGERPIPDDDIPF